MTDTSPRWRIMRHPSADAWSVEVDTREGGYQLSSLRFLTHNGLLSQWPWWFETREQAENVVALAQLLGWKAEGQDDET